MNKLGVILKLTERCNLNCTYCYFFNGPDDSYKRRPARIDNTTIKSLLVFLYKGIEELKLDVIDIGFHGGEPLLYGRENLRDLCEALISSLSSKVKLRFTLQTNGLLITKQWIELFKEYSIDIGISIDGPKKYHDQHRIDFQGRGSYDRLLNKIELLHESSMRFGVLTVINPEISGKDLYNFITKELKVNSFDILLPHLTHDQIATHTMSQYAQCLVEIFNIWTAADNPCINIRFFNSFLRIFLGYERLIYGIGATNKLSLPLITIRGDGELGPATGLMYTDPDTVTNTGANIKDVSLKQLMDYPIFLELAKAQIEMPEKCQSCCWENICAGGNIIDRFGKKNRFNNPSSYCYALQEFYSHMTKYLLISGIPLAKINERLNLY